jgi:hypothetical protein
MRKIWLAVLVSLSFLLLAGCQEQELLNDGPSFTVEVASNEGVTLLSEVIMLVEGDERTTVEIIDEAIDLDYSNSSYGNFVNGVGGFYPTEYGITYNYYFIIIVDREAIATGIDDIELRDGMEIIFQETTMLDPTDVLVDRLIFLYADAYRDMYITDAAINHYVVAALGHLADKGYIDPLTPPAYQANVTTIQEAFKTAVFQKTFDLDFSDTLTALNGFTSADQYSAVSHLSALSLLEGDEQKINDLLDMLTALTIDDAEYAGMLMQAFSPYEQDVNSVNTAINLLVPVIQNNLTTSGITSWGSPSSSATAMVVIGLIAKGIDPRGDNFSTGHVDLIEALLLYETDGYFKWQLSSESADMLFSSPQVFGALVTYKIFRDVWGTPAFDLFNI